MLATENTQSLSDFRKKAAETIDRLNQSGEAEIITVNGEARAVLVAPAVYDEMAREVFLSRDVEAIRRSLQEHREGKGRDAFEFLDEVRTMLLAMKAKQKKSAAK